MKNNRIKQQEAIAAQISVTPNRDGQLKTDCLTTPKEIERRKMILRLWQQGWEIPNIARKTGNLSPLDEMSSSITLRKAFQQKFNSWVQYVTQVIQAGGDNEQ